MRGFSFTLLIAVAAVAVGPDPAAGGKPLPIVKPAGSPSAGAGRGGAAEATSARAAIPQAWLDAQKARERRWRSFPDLVVHPSREWVPHFRGRSGVRAPLESARSARSGGGALRPSGAAQVIKVALIRIEFNTDRGGSNSSGDGRFDLGTPGDAAPAIDRPPRNRKFYQDHVEALRRYYDAQSYGRVDIQGEVWPRQEDLAYRVSDMADYGPWAFGQSIYPAAAKMFKDFLLAADAQAKTLADPIPWHEYDGLLVIHAGSDLQSDVAQDSPEDIPTFSLGVADSDRVVFPDSTLRPCVECAAIACPPDPNDALAKYCPIRNAVFLPETINQDGYYGALNAVIAHECGHLLFGMADLYDIDYGAPVVGFWSLMDTGNLAGAVVPQAGGEEIYAVGLLPPSIDPFQRWFVGDALSFQELSYDGAATQILDGERNPDMRLVTLSADEYLLLENRAIVPGDTLELDQDPVSHVILGPKNPDRFEYDSLLPGGGILTWHVDQSVLTYTTSLRANPGLGWNTDPRRLGVSVIEADGLADLGDPGSPLWFGSHRDPFYLSNNATLSDTTVPNLIPNVGTRPHVRLDFLDEPNDTMHFAAQRTWQLPGWPVATDFPPGGPHLLAVDADGDPADGALEVCWAGGSGADSGGVFVMKRNGQGMLGTSALLATLPDRAQPLLAALPAPQGPIGATGPSWLAVSTYLSGGSGGQVWMIDASINNPNPDRTVAGWPAALPPVTTPPVIVGAHSSASVLVGCEDGHIYALALDGSVRARSRDPLSGGIRGRLAAAQVVDVYAVADVPGPPTGAVDGWLVAAGAASGQAAVWVFDPVAGPNARMPFASGWPQSLATYAGFAPDFLWLDFDGAGGAGGNPSGCRAFYPELVAHDLNRLWAFCAEGRLLPGWGRVQDTLVASLGAGDPDGDGFPEVLTQTPNSRVAFVNLSGYPSPGWPRAGSPEGVLHEHPELTAPNPPQSVPTSSPPLALDLNGDGRCEVVAPNVSGILAALDAEGRTPAGWPLATGAGAGGSAVAADLDRDGFLELVAPDRGRSSTQTFGQLFAYSLPVAAGSATAHPWRMLGGDPGRTSALPTTRMAPTPAPTAGPLIQGSLKAYPNPARRRPVSFAYQLSEPADVEFRILDASGHEVAAFTRGGRRADNLEIWEPGDLPAGLYLARVRFRSSGREEVQVLPLGLIR